MNGNLTRTTALLGAALALLFFAAQVTAQASADTRGSDSPRIQAPAAPGATYTVNSASDVPDVNPGNGVCETAVGNGVCTLRAAIQEANANANADVINLQANTTYLLSRAGTDDTALNGDLDILAPVTINGAGAGSTIIDGNGGTTNDRVFHVISGATVVTMTGLTIQHGNSAGFGGGIFAAGNGHLTLDHTNVLSNTVGGLNAWGGGIFNAGTLDLVNVNVSGNSTGSSNPYGGGMYNQGNLNMVNSTFSGNTTTGPGGGMFLVSGTTFVIRSSTVSGNSANYGGGIYKAGGTLTMINTTLSGNFSSVHGGGIYNQSGATGLYNATVTKNTANSDNTGTGDGGGIASAGGTFTLANSIVAGNRNVIFNPTPVLNPDDCYGTITSQGYNILAAVDSSYCTISNYTLSSAYLGPLADNGGPTLTHMPQGLSPAIDGGNPAGCNDNLGAALSADQRGYIRPTDGNSDTTSVCDAGAVETNSLPPCPETPLPATLLTPTNGQTAKKTTVTLSWRANCATPTYRLLVKQDSKKGPVAAKPNVGTALTFQLKGLLRGHTYYWKVKTCSVKCKTTGYFSFTVKP